MRLHILIDTGSTHNFINELIVERLRREVQPVSGIWIKVANEQELKCTAMCQNFEWKMQQQDFKVDMYLLPLGSFEIILEIQWLRTLDNITWNFQALTMSFTLEDKVCFLQGECI